MSETATNPPADYFKRVAEDILTFRKRIDDWNTLTISSQCIQREWWLCFLSMFLSDQRVSYQVVEKVAIEKIDRYFAMRGITVDAHWVLLKIEERVLVKRGNGAVIMISEIRTFVEKLKAQDESLKQAIVLPNTLPSLPLGRRFSAPGRARVSTPSKDSMAEYLLSIKETIQLKPYDNSINPHAYAEESARFKKWTLDETKQMIRVLSEHGVPHINGTQWGLFSSYIKDRSEGRSIQFSFLLLQMTIFNTRLVTLQQPPQSNENLIMQWLQDNIPPDTSLTRREVYALYLSDMEVRGISPGSSLSFTRAYRTALGRQDYFGQLLLSDSAEGMRTILRIEESVVPEKQRKKQLFCVGR